MLIRYFTACCKYLRVMVEDVITRNCGLCVALIAKMVSTSISCSSMGASLISSGVGL